MRLITNFKKRLLPLEKIAIESAQLQHYIIAEAYNVIGEELPEYLGLYIDEDYAESLEGQRAIELYISAAIMVEQQFIDLLKQRGMLPDV